MGHKSVQECQKYITSSEFLEWQAYFLLEPFGSERDDQRAGTIASAIYNVNRGKGKKPIQWSDIFLPYEKRKPKDWTELLSMVEVLNEAFGGVDLRQNKNTPIA